MRHRLGNPDRPLAQRLSSGSAYHNSRSEQRRGVIITSAIREKNETRRQAECQTASRNRLSRAHVDWRGVTKWPKVGGEPDRGHISGNVGERRNGGEKFSVPAVSLLLLRRCCWCNQTVWVCVCHRILAKNTPIAVPRSHCCFCGLKLL